MTLVQLEYIVALDTYRSFVLAAEKCFVTQPTLSMQIQKLEETLGVKIFDRSRQPVSPTEMGSQIIEQARTVLLESQRIREVISNQATEVAGELKVAVIPTVAPYLLPKVIIAMMSKHPHLKLTIEEQTTEQITHNLKNGTVDCALMATPLLDGHLIETPLYYENFVAYVSKNSALYKDKEIKSEDLITENLWLLNEGHCLRNQVMSFCKIKKPHASVNFEYNTGSIETLIKMVDLNSGVTILPELALQDLSEKQLLKVRAFKDVDPAREISLVTQKNFIKRKLIQTLKEEILDSLPKKIKQKKKKEVIAHF